MDRIEFVHSINSDMVSTSDLFIKYFDQSMLLYSLVPEGSKVIVSNNSLNSIEFSVTTTKTNANHLSKIIDATKVFTPYKKYILVECTQENNTIDLKMTM